MQQTISDDCLATLRRCDQDSSMSLDFVTLVQRLASCFPVSSLYTKLNGSVLTDITAISISSNSQQEKQICKFLISKYFVSIITVGRSKLITYSLTVLYLFFSSVCSHKTSQPTWTQKDAKNTNTSDETPCQYKTSYITNSLSHLPNSMNRICHMKGSFHNSTL